MLLDAVNAAGIDQLIHISTSEVYGTSQQHLMNEDHLPQPAQPVCGGQDRSGAARLLLLGNIPDARDDRQAVQQLRPEPASRELIPCFITSALRDEPLPMHGTGKSTRDWIYVEDTCRGVDAILRSPRDVTIGEVFNLGTGIDTSVLTITETLLDTLGKPRDLIQPVAERPGQVDRHCADYSKVTALCGWEPKVDIEEGLRRTVDWYVANREWWDAVENERTRSTPVVGYRRRVRG